MPPRRARPPVTEPSPRAGGFLGAIRDAAWLDRRRLDAYTRILLVIEIAAFLFLMAGTHGLIVPLDKPITTDFVSFYAAGLQANLGQAPAVYDQASHLLAEQASIGVKGFPYNYFFYPPVYLLICQGLARLPYLLSFVLWESLSGLAYLWAIRAILPPGRTLLPFIAYPAVFVAVGTGQNSLLSAALFGGATVLVERRPWIAGMLFGALCYKPHFALLVPVALLAGRHFRCFLAAAVTVAALIGLSLLLYGTETWSAFLVLSASKTTSLFAAGKIPFAGLVSPYAAMRMLGLPDPAAWDSQIAISVAMAILVAVVWWGHSSLAVKSTILLAATLLAMPVILFYDLTLAALALAWIWRESLNKNGQTLFLPWEKAIFVVVFIVPIVSRGLGTACHIPIGPFAALVILRLSVVRWRRYRIRQAAKSAFLG